MWFGTRGGRTVVHTGRSIIHSVLKDEGNSTSTFFFLLFMGFLIIPIRFCVSENQILNVNFVKETQVINSKVQLTIE